MNEVSGYVSQIIEKEKNKFSWNRVLIKDGKTRVNEICEELKERKNKNEVEIENWLEIKKKKLTKHEK